MENLSDHACFFVYSLAQVMIVKGMDGFGQNIQVLD